MADLLKEPKEITDVGEFVAREEKSSEKERETNENH